MVRLFVLHLPSSVEPEIFESLGSHLSQESRDRVKRYRRPQDALRSLAGQLIPIWYFRTSGLVNSSEKIVFGKGDMGKPILVEPTLDPKMDFNTSHDGSYVLFSACKTQIGVDVMVHPTDPLELQEALQDQLTLRERQQLLAALTDKERARLLTVLWTVKEGYTKAIGEGIVFGLQRIEVLEGEGLRNGMGSVEFRVDGMKREGWRCEIGDQGDAGWAVIWDGGRVEDGDLGVEEVHVNWDVFVKFFQELDAGK